MSDDGAFSSPGKLLRAPPADLPDVKDQISASNFQFSTLCSLLCKGSNFASSEKSSTGPFAFTSCGATSTSFREWNSVWIAVLAGMVLGSSSSNRRSKEVLVLLVSLVVVEGAPAVDRDLLTNQVCQFQVTGLAGALRT